MASTGNLKVNLTICNAGDFNKSLIILTGSEDHLNKMMEEFTTRRKLIVEGLKSLNGVTQQ